MRNLLFALAILSPIFAAPLPAMAQSSELMALYERFRTALINGKKAEAETLVKQALEKAFGSEHPAIALSLKNYARLLRETGRNEEADAVEERANAIWAKHPDWRGYQT